MELLQQASDPGKNKKSKEVGMINFLKMTLYFSSRLTMALISAPAIAGFQKIHFSEESYNLAI